ncbi:MAG: hypothetical protein JSW05_00375 [Candidatus Thorarchaeota archaeon]|nr:MAG: hypothetical protein JSW05_00375 [Candidatus Thorarchaeota archaeon]
MPLAVLTTSRKTSNRVRSFVRDLWSVLPGTERFNRGSMNSNELIARIQQSDAKMALVVTLWKGNPGTIQFISSTGSELLTVKLESAALRREVSSLKGLRIHSVYAVTVPKSISRQGRNLADFIAALFNFEATESDTPVMAESDGSNNVEIRIEDLGGGKILWTHLHAVNGEEMGPRIRVLGVRR